MKSLIALAAAATVFAAPAFAGNCGSYGKQVAANYTTVEKSDIVATAQAAGQFGTLLAAAEAAGLVGALQGEGPLTVFAPTDAAFAKLGDETIANLLLPENKDQLAGILKYHVISGKVKSEDLAGQTLTATTLNGIVNVDGTNGVKVNDATVIQADIMASNGVIHVVDTVLIPHS